MKSETDKESISIPLSSIKEFYAVWYDNGTGWFEGNSLYEAESPQEALQKAGGKMTEFGTEQVVTAGWDYDPNVSREYILA